MKTTHDLSSLTWSVAGFNPHEWRLERSLEIGATPRAEVPPIPARVPGSVQLALRNAGLIPDWNLGLNARLCEWVENRHWIYETTLPDDWFASGGSFRLHCLGLDGNGCIRLNQREITTFASTHVPVVVDLTPFLVPGGNRLQIIFECPPRWLGQFGFTSQIKEWKPRFNYFWDWTSRLVQIGIWDSVLLERLDEGEIEELHIAADFDSGAGLGRLWVGGSCRAGPDSSLRIVLEKNGKILREEYISAGNFSAAGIAWTDLQVEPWWPNGLGEQPLYRLIAELIGIRGGKCDRLTRSVGFRRIEWRACEGADEADPWICAVNGRAFFLQGVNWTPIRPNFADVPVEEYRKRLLAYHDLGCNVLRVWGGGFLEKECFYDLCDELGLLVWQEFPLSSSGLDNYPPDDVGSIAELTEIAGSFIRRRRHHASMLLWCGGNELRAARDSDAPVGFAHPLIARFRDLVQELDPGRRFLPSAPCGPRFNADRREFGRGLHWAVNGPWKAEGSLDNGWLDYWRNDDALFRSETGAPGPSPAALTRGMRGDCVETPVSVENPLWRRAPWWIEREQFVAEIGRDPRDLEEYVHWGQQRQAHALAAAAENCKKRFPRCGGFLVWMGHDCFPCAANTSILDFNGDPKPAALALARIFKAGTPVM